MCSKKILEILYGRMKGSECLKQVQVTMITQSIISNFRTLDFEVSINSCHDYLLTLCSAVQYNSCMKGYCFLLQLLSPDIFIRNVF